MEAVELVEYDHVEGRGRRALFHVAVDVEVGVIGPPVRQAVDQHRIPVEGEDHRLVPGEERVEVLVG